MFTQATDQRPAPIKLDTYIVVMASHEFDSDEDYPVPADTQVLELPYPSEIKVDRAFLEKDLSGWLQHGYYLQEFIKRGNNFEF